MKTLKKIVDLVWANRNVIDFGSSPQWDENSFLKEWIDSYNPNLWDNRPGWYWFETDISPTDFLDMPLPSPLPPKATKFSEVSKLNSERLDAEDIYKSKDFNVVYSGQENGVFTRIRTHFSLTLENTATGALGISSYPLSQRKWRANLFHEGMIDDLEGLTFSEIQILRQLVSETHGRSMVEICWRIEYGWPILCIK